MTIIAVRHYYPAMSQGSDTRHAECRTTELKFLVSTEAAGHIRGWARRVHLVELVATDSDGGPCHTATLYFDTADRAVYHRRGSHRRAKYRMRRYGRGDTVVLERKLRRRNRVHARRTVVPIEDVARICDRDSTGDWPGWWFHRRLLLRQLSPACRVDFRRTTLAGHAADGPIHLTLDDDVLAAPVGELRFGPADGAVPITRETIVEVSFPKPIPALVKRLIEEFALTPVRLSKFRLAMESVTPASIVGVVKTGCPDV